MANFQNKPKNVVVPPLKFGVNIPTLGVVSFPSSLVPQYKEVTGSSTVQFLSGFSFDTFVHSLLEKSSNSREGSAQHNLAQCINLMNYRQGCRQTDAPYTEFATVWEAYCKKRFYRDDAMTTYGKRVSMNIFVGTPVDKDSFRKLPLVYPLHTFPCDICYFLTTIKKGNSKAESPYADLDLASIHRYFESRIAFKSLEVTPAVVEEEPCYTPTSPQPAELDDAEPGPSEPAAPVKIRAYREVNTVTCAPKRLFPALEETPGGGVYYDPSLASSVVKIRKLDEMKF